MRTHIYGFRCMVMATGFDALQSAKWLVLHVSVGLSVRNASFIYTIKFLFLLFLPFCCIYAWLWQQGLMRCNQRNDLCYMFPLVYPCVMLHLYIYTIKSLFLLFLPLCCIYGRNLLHFVIGRLSCFAFPFLRSQTQSLA